MEQPQQLISEQLPTDGSHQPTTYLKKANDRLKEDGRRGKTVTINPLLSDSENFYHF